RLPSLALGTMKLAKRSTSVVVSAALKKGIDAIDTAPTYNNEEEIGAALAHQKLKPFIIVKVPKRATLPAQVRDEVLLSLQKLGREFVDLILLHWPCDAIEADSLSSVWKELEHLQAKKYCHFLGVCNFSIDALRTLIPLCSPNGRPILNQIERHPLLPQWELLDFCARHGIQLQAHSPLGQGRSEVLEQHVVVDISKATGLSPAQVVLKWNLQHGIAVVTKSTSDAHLSQ
ncbi:2,5-diketo-D-gluconic acid reductase A-like protein, partial [Phaeodactylum tricornutum CCAP 1055/1]